MSYRDIVKECTPGKLRTFAGLQLPFFGLIAWLQPAERFPSWVIPTALTISAMLAVIGLWKPTSIRPIYLLWMAVVYPLGFVVSHLALGLVYYAVITPIGVYRRSVHGDSLQRSFDDSSGETTCNSNDSYWEEIPQPKADTYFRQF